MTSTPADNGISVEVLVHGQSQPLRNDPQKGMCVYLNPGTRYQILITHAIDEKKEKRKKIAAVVSIDGNEVSTPPKLVGAQRIIEGFTDLRETVEVVNADGTRDYKIRNTIRPFLTKKPNKTTSRTNDHQMGKIKCEFYGVYYMRTVHQKNPQARIFHRKIRSQTQAPPGVLQTYGGGEQKQIMGHFNKGKKKPMANYNHSLGSLTITICDREYDQTLESLVEAEQSRWRTRTNSTNSTN